MYKITPQRIIYNGKATIVFWNDGTKTVVKRAEGTKDDKYNAFCAALAIKMYGSNSELQKMIKRAENAKKRTSSTPIKAGDCVRVLDGSHIPNYTGGWTKDMQDNVGKIFTVRRIDEVWGAERKSAELDGGGFIFDLRGLEKV